MQGSHEQVLPETPIPLIVDLDGTLISTDLLFESLFKVLRKQPLLLFLLPFWLLKGRSQLKHEIASRCDIDPRSLPYNEELLAYLKEQKADGRELHLVTASIDEFAKRIADHVGIFTSAQGSTPERNLKGKHKAAYLRETYGDRGYDYAGDSPADFPVWKSARSVFVVSGSQYFYNKVKKEFPEAERFDAPFLTARACVKQIRVHQWVKNLLIFVPAFMAHQIFSIPVLASAIAAFFSFSFLASGVYIINDLFDLDADREHPSKRHRPLAAGIIPLHIGACIVPILWSLSLVLACFLPLEYFFVLASYLTITTLYTFLLKRIEVLDIVTLAGLYTVRVFAGGMATDIEVSPWLLGFSLFMFLSLGCVKRYSELHGLRKRSLQSTRGRGYRAEDLEMIGQCGIASGYISALVLALYINSDDVVRFYSHPTLLWLLCPVILYWVSRTWLLAHRDEIHEDPIVFALRDKVSHIVAIISGIIALMAV